MVQDSQKLVSQSVRFASNTAKGVINSVKIGILTCLAVDLLHANTGFLDSNVCKESYPTLFNGIINLSRFLSQPIVSSEDACQAAKEVLGDKAFAHQVALLPIVFTAIGVSQVVLNQLIILCTEQNTQASRAANSQPQPSGVRSSVGNQTGHPLPADPSQPRAVGARIIPLRNLNLSALQPLISQEDLLGLQSIPQEARGQLGLSPLWGLNPQFSNQPGAYQVVGNNPFFGIETAIPRAPATVASATTPPVAPVIQGQTQQTLARQVLNLAREVVNEARSEVSNDLSAQEQMPQAAAVQTGENAHATTHQENLNVVVETVEQDSSSE